MSSDAETVGNREQTPQTMKVRGQVRHLDGTRLFGKIVRAFDKDLRSEELLGEHNTDAEGRYEIQYSAEQFSRAEKQHADLIVRAYDDGLEITSSAIIFNAASEETVNLIIDNDAYRGPSEYERLVQDLTPLLNGLSFTDLTNDDTHQDITFLSGETGQSQQWIGFLVTAHQLAQTTGLPPEVFYGFFRKDLPVDLPSLILQSRQTLRDALESALHDNLIPATLRSEIDSFVERLKQLMSSRVLQSTEGTRKLPTVELLSIAGFTAEEQEKVLNLFIENGEPSEEVWQQLRSELTDGKADDFEFALQIAKLTGNNIPLVKALQDLRTRAIVQSPRDLARSLDAKAWTELVNNSADGDSKGIPRDVPGATPQEKVTNYVNKIIKTLNDRFPTAFVAASVSRTPEIDANLVTQVLAQNPALDPSQPLSSDIDWTGLDQTEQVRAQQSFDSLRQELKMFPEFDHRRALGDASSSSLSLLDNPVRNGVAQFFTNEPEFEFANTHIDTYFAAHSAAFNGIPEEHHAAVTRQLKSMQRVSHVASNYEHMKALMGEGLDSAYRIAAIPERNFVDHFASVLGGETQAQSYYNIATQHTAGLVTIAAAVNDLLNGVAPVAVDNGNGAQALIKKLPKLEELFGSFDICECQHCRSVYGPTAYFVDLLQFLNPDIGIKPLEVLRKRRPDLEHIKLSCENTNTPLPYVDLVNEILEFYVEHQTINSSNGKQLAKNTGLSADELSANPEHTTDGAYDQLRDAVHSFQLPFNLPVETARTYFEHLGSSLYEVMEITQRTGAVPSSLARATEYLKITPEEAKIITGANFNPPKLPREFFGYTHDSVTQDEVDDKGKKVSVHENWRKNVARVPEFLRRTGISYPVLVELLKTRFINPDLNLKQSSSNVIVLFSPNSVCDLAKATIRHLDDQSPLLTDDELLKMHRFLRLWRKLGWSMQDFDKSLIALNPSSNKASNNIDSEGLQDLAHIEKLRTELRLPVVPLLSLWFGIDALGEDSLYHKLFLNKAVLNPVDPAFDLNDPQPQNPLLLNHIPTILAALEINADDLAAIQKATNLSQAPLTIANLTILFRHALLAKGLKIKVKQLLVLKDLTGINPFATPAKTVEFVEKSRKVKSSHHTVAQLNYIYRNSSEPAKNLAPTEDEILLLATQLQKGFKAIADDNGPEDPTGELTQQNLGVVWENELVDKMIAFLDGSTIYATSLVQQPELTFPSAADTEVPLAYDVGDQAFLLLGKLTEGARTLLLCLSDNPEYKTAINKLFTDSKENVKIVVPAKAPPTLTFPADVQAKISFDANAQALRFVGPMSPLEKMILLSLSGKDIYLDAVNDLFQQPGDFLLETKAPFLGLADAVELPDALAPLLDPDVTSANKFEFVLKRLLSYLHSRELIKQVLSEELKLEAAITRLLLEDVLKSLKNPASPDKRLIDDCQALIDNDTAAFTACFLLLHRIALLINGFKMTAPEVAYISAHANDFANFDLNALSGSPVVSPSQFFMQWVRLFDLFSLRDALPQSEVTLIDLFAVAAASPLPAEFGADMKLALSETTGWDASSISDLATTFNLKDSHFKNEVKLVLLWECVALARRLGVSVSQLQKWATEEPTSEQAKEIITTVKAKYDEEQWLAVAKPLNNRLRERRKDALIAYILADPTIGGHGITDSNQLFEHFLIDVNMSACFMTSRIKQAISSVQLFVQRCLLNLEAVPPSAIDAQQWNTWMKWYRVWEANRKVFLYPENWIEPELRDDKSPFFREMETQLLQNEVTDDSVEQCLLNYLEKLDEVARLEICGLYWQLKPNSDELDLLHVFGRTFNSPHIYYYRNLRAATGVWTPWEKVNVDIEGDHLIPVIYNRRLQLYWPIFVEKPDEEQDLSGPTEIESPAHELWRERKKVHDAWQNLINQKHIAKDKELKRANNDNLSEAEQAKAMDLFDILMDEIAELENNEPPHPGPEPVPGTIETVPDVRTHWEIKLAWSEYRNKKWSPKKISAAKFLTEELRKYWLPPKTAKNQFRFKSRIDSDGSLLIIPNWAGWVGGGYLTSFDARAFQVIGCNGKVQIKQQAFWLQSGAPPNTHNEAMTLEEDPGVHRLRLPLGDLAGYGNPENTVTRSVLKKTPDTFSLFYAHQLHLFVAQAGLFYQDYRRTYLVMPVLPNPRLKHTQSFEQDGDYIAYQELEPLLKFSTFFHPHVCGLVKALNQKGIPGIFNLDVQQLGHDDQPPNTIFENTYDPTWVVDPDYPREVVDFDHRGPYSLYNWELFFHVPLMIADRLSKNQRFEEAMKWFHYIFDPTDGSTDEESPRRFWKFLPFYDNLHPEKQQIARLLESLNAGDSELIKQVEQWRADPFKPHLIARSRITAYQKSVIMKYVDNLIAWGDQLFRRDTIESINEATQLYIMAHHILGPRPELVPQRVKKVDKTFDELKPDLDEFSNAFVLLENEFPYSSESSDSDGNGLGGNDGLGMGRTFYFCIPKNDKLLGYWDTVDDRLFKIRHCMNIEGLVRELPLFEPPIDPALLVKAAAMGLDLNSVLNDINSPQPHYRFGYMVQKALELCAELKSLGGALLSTLEKKDAEELALLRAEHEISLLEAVKEIRKQQIHEGKLALEALQKSRHVIEERHRFYDTIQERNTHEREHLDQLDTARTFQLIGEGLELAAAAAALLPDLHAGTSGISASPVAVVAYGGLNMGLAAQATSKASSMVASHHTYQANMASIEGGWERRSDEWNLQKRLAAKELDQIDKQIAGAQVRIAIAEKELANHEKQIENSAAVEEFMRNKYTNDELYSWMVSQISAVYFQSYKLAYDTAKRAEGAYRFDLGVASSSFIQFGYWDSLRKGLLSGERLWLDLKRLEMAYHDLNKREYELTRHVSLLQLDPIALLQLRMTGECTVAVPEALFDLDCPGHYFRRIKSVSMSIPSVVGPYSSINCTLTLLKSSIRRSSLLNGNNYARVDAEDGRFSDDFGSVESIVTSTGQSDGGMFETNLRDERYLPFEGSGVVSEWRLQLPAEIRQFNYDTISDVIMHFRYTAREGGTVLRKAAVENLKTSIEEARAVGSVRLFSVRHEFPSEWAKFKSVTSSNNPLGLFELTINLREEHYPFWSKSSLEAIKRVDVYARTGKASVEVTSDQNDKASLLPDPSLGNLLTDKLEDGFLPSQPTGEYTLYFDDQTMTELWLALTWG